MSAITSAIPKNAAYFATIAALLSFGFAESDLTQILSKAGRTGLSTIKEIHTVIVTGSQYFTVTFDSNLGMRALSFNKRKQDSQITVLLVDPATSQSTLLLTDTRNEVTTLEIH